MIFSGPAFLYIFLPLTLLSFYAVRRSFGHRPSLVLLFLASLIFYAWWDVRFLPLILVSILFNFFIARLIRRRGGKWLGFGVAANLALLGVFKYTDFFIGNFNAVSGANFGMTNIPLPLAISFFTFQQIAYLVDVSRRDTEPGDAGTYSLFVAFFPQLIAGPIVHHKTIAPQYKDESRQKNVSVNLAIGFSIFAVGLAKKVLLADNMAPYASSVFDAAETGAAIEFWRAWGGALAYSFQIFFDFSGYSDMAMGLAKMFGFQIPVNFNAPYRARSVTDFWRRWHITLSQFLRDYLYIPLGGNRQGRPRQLANLATVMLLGGLWHGAAWTFVVWGGLHGLALIWNRLLDDRFPNGLFGRLPALSILSTFLFITITWVFFKAESFGAASEILTGMAGLNGLGQFEDDPMIAAALGLFIVWVLPDTVSVFSKVIEPEALQQARVVTQKGPRWNASPIWAAALAILMFFAMINVWSVSEFIYYNF